MRLRGMALASIVFFIFTMGAAFPAEETKTSGEDANVAAPKLKYRAQKTVNFEELLIQGDLKRPEITVVTGNTAQGSDGLLRLRENFYDRMKAEAGEEMP